VADGMSTLVSDNANPMAEALIEQGRLKAARSFPRPADVSADQRLDCQRVNAEEFGNIADR